MTAFRDAAAYERGRPGWPPAAVDWLCSELGVGAASAVADVGAGTGKLTRELVGRARRVVAVEPSEPMLAVLRSAVPGAEAVRGSAEALPLGDASVQALFVAEAFHWFGSPEVVAEQARVIVPGGGLALLWNRPDRWPSVPALDARRERRSFPYGEDRWRAAVDASPAFGSLVERTFAHEQRLDRASFVAQVASFSWMQSVGDAERQTLLGIVAAEVPDDIVIPFATTAIRALRR